MSSKNLCRITDVKFRSNKLHPIIASFQNGELIPDNAENIKCSVQNGMQKDDKLVVEINANNNCTYRGTKLLNSSDISRTVIAIRNKKTNNIRLIEADTIQFAPVFPDSTPAEKEEPKSKGDEFSELYRAFGSKKIKRKIELRSKMRFDVNTMAPQLREAASAVEVTQDQLDSPSMAELNTFIPCNRQATSVGDVYQLDDLISPLELDSLHDEAERILSDPESCTEEKYTQFFCYFLKEFLANKNIDKMKILVYAECLLYFLNLQWKDLRVKNLCVCPYSEIVNSKILNAFTVQTSSGRTRSIAMRDKALGHVLILGFLLNNFQLDTDLILQSVKLNRSRIQELCHAIGAVPANKDNKNVMVLKLPLPAPASQFSGKRKRSRQY